MKIIINTSNLKTGGGIQVAHSFLNEILQNKEHTFYVVLSTALASQIDINSFPSNFIFHYYSIKPSIVGALTGNNSILSDLEAEIAPDRVFSVFAPTYWNPKCYHIAGFAKAHYIFKDLPYIKNLSILKKVKLKLLEWIHLWNFKYFCDKLITESEEVSARLHQIFPIKKIYTVTNNYNKIFDIPEKWDRSRKLSEFSGVTLLTISASYPHKNLEIIPRVVTCLNDQYPLFKFRFILSINQTELKGVKSVSKHIVFLGSASISQCPYIYQQCDFVFLPTLLECFSASYPEAMRMRKPILTSDLHFARGLCGDAAVYFNPMDPLDIAEKIFELANNPTEQNKLINNGVRQLKNFDTSQERAQKYIKIIE